MRMNELLIKEEHYFEGKLIALNNLDSVIFKFKSGLEKIKDKDKVEEYKEVINKLEDCKIFIYKSFEQIELESKQKWLNYRGALRAEAENILLKRENEELKKNI